MAKASSKKAGPAVAPIAPAKPAAQRFAEKGPSSDGYDKVKPDARNANIHTERGVGMLEHSLRTYGAGRSILTDKDGNVIAGNATLERANELGIPLQFVETDGKTLVVVRRKDLSIDSPEGRGLAIADNRVAQIDLSWDLQTLSQLHKEGVDLGQFFLPAELEEMAKALNDPTFAPVPQASTPQLDKKTPVKCPHCGEEFVPK